MDMDDIYTNAKALSTEILEELNKTSDNTPLPCPIKECTKENLKGYKGLRIHFSKCHPSQILQEAIDNSDHLYETPNIFTTIPPLSTNEQPSTFDPHPTPSNSNPGTPPNNGPSNLNPNRNSLLIDPNHQAISLPPQPPPPPLLIDTKTTVPTPPTPHPSDMPLITFDIHAPRPIQNKPTPQTTPRHTPLKLPTLDDLLDLPLDFTTHDIHKLFPPKSALDSFSLLLPPKLGPNSISSDSIHTSSLTATPSSSETAITTITSPTPSTQTFVPSNHTPANSKTHSPTQNNNISLPLVLLEDHTPSNPTTLIPETTHSLTNHSHSDNSPQFTAYPNTYQQKIDHLLEIIRGYHIELQNYKDTITQLQAQNSFKNEKIELLKRNIKEMSDHDPTDSDATEHKLNLYMIKISELEQKCHSQEATLRTYSLNLLHYAHLVKTKQKALGDTTKKLHNSDEKVVQFNNLTENLRTKIRTLESKLHELNKSLEPSISRNNSLEMDLARLENTIAENELTLKNLKQENLTLTQSLNTKQTTMTELQNTIDQTQQRINQRNNSLEIELSCLENTLEEKELTLKKLKEENLTLTQSLSTQQITMSELQNTIDLTQQILNQTKIQCTETQHKYLTLLESTKPARAPSNTSSFFSPPHTTVDRSSQLHHTSNLNHNTPDQNDLVHNNNSNLDNDNYDDVFLLPHNSNPPPHHSINMMKTPLQNVHIQQHDPARTNNLDPYLMANLLNNYNIRTLTHPELYTNGLPAAKALSKWLNSIDVAVDNPDYKVKLAIQKLDVEILERLKRYNENLHKFTWDQLRTRLQSYLTLPDFRSTLTELYLQKFEGEEHPSAYFSTLSSLRRIILSVYPSHIKEIPSLQELIKHCMIAALHNPYRNILNNDLRICNNNLDDFLTKFAMIYDSTRPEALIINYRHSDFANNISTSINIPNTPKFYPPGSLLQPPAPNQHSLTNNHNYPYNQYNQNFPYLNNNQSHPNNFFRPPYPPTQFHETTNNRFQTPQYQPMPHQHLHTHQANQLQTKPWTIWKAWDCPCGQHNDKKNYNCQACKIPGQNQPTDCSPCQCGRRVYIQSRYCFYCKSPKPRPTSQHATNQETPSPIR